MKKLKKFAALLLVGVMALALLTACGGGGGPTEEQKVLAQISQEKGVQVTNNAELRAVAERNLNEEISMLRSRSSAMQERSISIRIGWKVIWSSPSPPDMIIRILS